MSNVDAVNALLEETVEPKSVIKRNGRGQPVMPHPETGVETTWRRNSQLGDVLEDSHSLQIWNERNLVRGIGQSDDLIALAASVSLEMNDDDKATCDRVRKDAVDRAGGNRKSNIGTGLHGCIANRALGVDGPIPESLKADVDAFFAALKTYGLWTYNRYVETIVLNTEFGTLGTTDGIWDCDQPLLPMAGDIKTGNVEAYARKFAIQLATYAGSDWEFDKETKVWKPMPALNQDIGLIFHVPAGKARCDIYNVNIEAGRAGARLALDVLEWRKQRVLVVPFSAAVSDEPVPDLTASLSTDEPVCLDCGKHVDGTNTFRQVVPDTGEIVEPLCADDYAKRTNEAEGTQISEKERPADLFEERKQWVRDRMTAIVKEHGRGDELANAWQATCQGIATFKDGGPKTHQEIDRVAGACRVVETAFTLSFFDPDPANRKTKTSKWLQREQENNEQLAISK